MTKLARLWRKSMHEKQLQQFKNEHIEQYKDEDPFAVDWSNLDGRNVAQGNWD